MIYLAFFNFISLLISKAITTTHIFIRKTFNGINKKSIYLIDSKNVSLKILRFTDSKREKTSKMGEKDAKC